MYVEEEVGRKTATVDVEDWEQSYREVKDILERRFDFDEIEEARFLHHKDKGTVVSRINIYEEMDKFTEIELNIILTYDLTGEANRATLTIDSTAGVSTRYPEESSWQRHPLYFALRSIWDKLVYGWARGRWKGEARETLTEVHDALRGAFRTVEG